MKKFLFVAISALFIGCGVEEEDMDAERSGAWGCEVYTDDTTVSERKIGEGMIEMHIEVPHASVDALAFDGVGALSKCVGDMDPSGDPANPHHPQYDIGAGHHKVVEVAGDRDPKTWEDGFMDPAEATAADDTGRTVVIVVDSDTDEDGVFDTQRTVTVEFLGE